MKPARYLTLSFLISSTISGALSAEEGDVEMGRNIAEEYCVHCHDVSRSGPFKMDPPSFAAIAKYRSEDQIRKRIVNPTHEDMPRYIKYMIGGNIGDMVAYIVSLED
ncbi:cytochrome c [Ruegeria sp. 2205SS24-7]|uniref:c-type cytochrome n=1 Tax=Ruegeria discodermiae TaxID=3064389 RepID=UPI00274231EF|nr:cytochrome c [Ruegeria sp. 2205SS24-7]MDP5220245.1 cytochrome c [Ruegeria sp. 2205SS24-7]